MDFAPDYSIYRFGHEQIAFYETIKDIIIELHKNERKHKKKNREESYGM